MNYYKYLNLDCTIVSNKLKEYLSNNPKFLDESVMAAWRNANAADVLEKVPELQDLFNPLNIRIRYLAFFVSSVMFGKIHIDADEKSKCRINIPVLNCENTETRFFKTPDTPVKIFQPDGIPLWDFDPSSCIHVDQFYLTQPVVFRNTEPHQVVSNNIGKTRVSCTIGFHEDIEYLLL